MPAALDSIVAGKLEPWELLGLQQHLLCAVAAHQCRPALIIYRMAGRLVSIGRYHLYSGAEQRDGAGAYRRLTGGRITGAGDGWVGLALIIPSRTALLAPGDSQLKPDQVMNRHVRGVLRGLRTLGLECFYPGRDAITMNRREIAMCTFEAERSGAVLFEVLLAVSRGMDDLAGALELLDPTGELTSPLYDRESATSIARELAREPSHEEIASALESGYALHAGELERRALTTTERAAARERGAALRAADWLHDRVPLPDAKVTRMSAQLGFIEARIRLDSGNRIEQAAISGDLIANSAGLAQFERALADQPLDLMTVSKLVMRTFGDGVNYCLGAGDLMNLAQLLMRAT